MTKFRITLALAFLFVLASTAAAGTLTASTGTVTPGGPVTVTWSDVTGPTILDWMGRYVQGAPDGAYDDYVFTSTCTHDRGITPTVVGLVYLRDANHARHI